ncbi:Gfo/Idh/MocA family oxidoreductase [Psychromarinibacter sp. C21-152]|uniref:Gfo/Idh/MocA family oxidoreductase n=1 Tax=Psychromarinibacter sediminicola TaxID=3033385 RepID=A0AAE3NP12_9RHOB|nr:Gfo/Idh/MocA family oxidoreductase [Psychromarinibacter sediminicola]MDF0599471.1 Gfo/Idh/MocA family oxidoreductase [Psychromarinibacter sediminicola]
MTPLGVGLIGCGDISATYLRLAPLFPDFEIRAVASRSPGPAQARAAEFGLRAASPEALLAADDIDAILNLTPPAAHAEVTRAALAAGKHVYSEKPLATTTDAARALLDLAQSANLRIGCAPDTILGGACQAARGAIETGRIGRVVSGTCHFLNAGMEQTHPNPWFFFQPGGGPGLDVGPYYVTTLIALLGPVKRVAAMTGKGADRRMIGAAARRGDVIEVRTPTTISALLDFARGAVITLSLSWDVRAHGHRPIELYGTHGSLFLPDPDFFAGDVIVAGTADDAALPAAPHPFGRPNDPAVEGRANYRGAGLADMARAIREDRPHRCSGELAFHCLEVLSALPRSGEAGRFVDIESACARPDPFPSSEADRLRHAAPAP